MTKSERQAHIELWEQSGQSKKAYCDQMGIRYGTFISWFRQISGEVPCGNFIDLGKTSSSTVEVLLPNGIRLYYTNSFTKNHLKELMDV